MPVTKANLSYTDSDIQTLSDTEWILLRPENHIRTTDDEGQLHIIREIFDNALDETEISPGGAIDIWMFLDKKHKTYQIAIRDNGRGVPLGKLVQSFTQLKTSGKYDKSSYHTAGGLNGVGGKVAMVLSENFKVVTFRENQIGHLYFHRAELLHESVTDTPIHGSGTLVVLEPRKDYFSGVDTFINSTHDSLIKLALLLGMFSRNTHITARIVYKSIHPDFWYMNADESLRFIEPTYQDDALVVVNGADNTTAMNYLRELWQVDSPFIWKLEKIDSSEFPDMEYALTTIDERGSKRKHEVQLTFNISLFLPKILRGTFTTSIVNNIPMKDQSSSHVTGLLLAIKAKLAAYIENSEHQQFFVDLYKIPLCAAIAIKYGDVRFTSLSKDGFKSTVFESRYLKMLERVFETYPEDKWRELYDLLSEDIVIRYSQYYNKPLTSKKDAKKVSLDLIDKKFYDCETTDRTKAELFIVEGVSASHIKLARRPEFQSVFMIRGKPLNVTKSSTGKPDPISRLKSFSPYTDLMKILNIQPGQTDLSTSSYGKIILMQDADVDGGHIRALHIGGLYAINPLIIESGMVYLANPPLYEIELDDKSKSKIFVRSKSELISFRVECLYKPALTISVGDDSGKAFSKPRVLKDQELTEFCQIVVSIGEIFSELSKKLVIPEIILEKLTYLTSYLYPGKVDIVMLRKEFGSATRYNPALNIVTVAHGEDDVSFSIDGLNVTLYEEIMGILHKLCWKNLRIYVSTNYTNTLQNTKVSLVQLYQIFENLNKKLNTTRHKGLGGMDKESLDFTCVNPKTRYLHRITSLGEYDRIQELLGDDSKARKKILEDHGLLD